MGASYAVMLIAFYVDNRKSLNVWRSTPTVGYWLIPGIIGFVATARATHRRGNDKKTAHAA
jgi:hypothetical protein